MKNNEIIFNLITNRDKVLKKHISDDLIEYADEHRVLLPILKILDDEKWPEHEELYTWRYNEFLKIMQELNKQKIIYLNIKGMVMNRYYPRDLPRQSNDFDILVKDVNNYWLVHNILVRNQYTMKTFPVLYQKKGQIVGFCKYFKKVEDGKVIEFEVNIGGFAIGYYDCYIDDGLFETYKIVEEKGIEINIPNDRYNLLIFICETAGRSGPRFRDIIDFHFMNKHIEKEAIDFVYQQLKSSYLQNVLKVFVKIENKIANKEKCSLENHLTTLTKNEIYHTLPMLLKSCHRIKTLYYYYLRMLGDYLIRKDRYLKIVKYIEDNLNPYTRFKLGIPTHCIPISDEIKGEWEFREQDPYYYLRTNLGAFLLSNFCLFNEGEFEKIKKMCLEIFE